MRNIRVITPGFESTYESHPFHPTLVSYLQRFKVVRFMDWMASNVAQSGVWANRTTRAWRSYNQPHSDGTTDGVALEDMILLANQAGVSPWFSVPYNADDNYITNMAGSTGRVREGD